MSGQVLGPNDTHLQGSTGEFTTIDSMNIESVGKPRAASQTEYWNMDVFKQAALRYNPLYMNSRYAVIRSSMGNDAQPFFDPFKDLDPKYYGYARLIEDAKSPWDLDLAKTYIDTLAEEKTLANSNIYMNLLGTFVGAGFAPEGLLLSMGASAALRATGYGPTSLAGAFGSGAAIGLAVDAPLEVANMNADPAYKLDEVWTGLALSALGGGIFDMGIHAAYHGGGSHGKVVSPTINKTFAHDLARSTEDAINPQTRWTSPLTKDPVEFQKYAADTKLADPAGFVTAPAFKFFTEGKGAKFQPSISARLMGSPIPEVRQLTTDLVEHNFVTQGMSEGKAINPSVESLVDMNVIQKTTKLEHTLNDSFAEYRQAGGEMKFGDFESEVVKAVRAGSHADPTVNKAAKFYKTLMDDYLERYKASGIFGKQMDNPLDGENYFTRVYDRDIIQDNIGSWRELLRKNLLDPVSKDLSDAIKKEGIEIPVEEFDARLAKAVDKSVDEVTSKILGSHYFDMEGLSWSDANAKARTLHISDADLEPFLRSDLGNIGNLYIKRAEKDLALHERFGTTNKDEILKKIDDAYQNALNSKNFDPTLQDRMKQDMEDLSVMFDRLYGTRGLPKDPTSFGSQTVKGLSKYNVIRMLGSVAFSQLPEIARSTILRFTEKVLAPDLRNMGAAFDKIKFTKEDLTFLGAHLEHSQRLMHMVQGDAAMSNELARAGKVSTTLDAAMVGFTKISGMGALDNFTRSSLAVTGGRQIYNLTKKLAEMGTLTKKGSQFLAKFGIDDKNAKAIMEQAKKHGETVDGVFYLNASNWEGQTGDIMRTAIRKYVNQYLINPGLGDRFRFADAHPITKLIMQFRSYAQGAFSRTLLPGMQEKGDLDFLGTMVTMIALGYLVNYVMRSLNPHTYQQEQTPKQQLVEAVNRSGAVPYLFDLYSTGSNTFFGGGTTRQQTQGRLDTLLGPSAGLLSRQVPALGRAATGNMVAGDVRTLKQLAPFNNIVWWNFYLAKKANEADQRLKVTNKLDKETK